MLDIGERAEKRWLEGINEGIEIGRWNALRTLDLPEVLGNEDEERMRDDEKEKRKERQSVGFSSMVNRGGKEGLKKRDQRGCL